MHVKSYLIYKKVFFIQLCITVVLGQISELQKSFHSWKFNCLHIGSVSQRLCAVCNISHAVYPYQESFTYDTRKIRLIYDLNRMHRMI